MTITKERLIKLKNEIKMAEALNKEELEPVMYEAISRYLGKYVPRYGAGWDILLNEIYPIIQNNLPSIFFRNPRAFLKPKNRTYIAKKRNPITSQMEEVEMDSSKSARTQENILNYALLEMKYKREVRKILLDALLFPHGILWHGYKGDFGMTEEQSLFIKDDRPFVKRLSPLRFIKDPCVSMSNLDEGMWQGRIIDIPYDEFMEDEDLDIDKKLIKGFKAYGDKVGSASINAYLDKGGADYVKADGLRRSLLDYADDGFRKSSQSNYVRIYEIFLRPTKKEKRKGSTGNILLLTNEQEKPLRDSDWKIKAEGFPGIPLQFNELNDSMFSLADIDTYKTIADQKNIITNLQLRNAQENSKVWVAIAKGGSNEEDIEKIQKGDQTIILFDGDTVQGKMSVASAGGQASSELYLIDQRIQKNLEDKSGVTDLKRGFLQSGEESAASVKIRAAGGGARPAYRQDIMKDFLIDSLHYLNQLIKQFLPYEDAVRIVGSLDLEWSENPSKEELQADTDVEIDVISMLPENPEKELDSLNQILSLMVQGLENPVISQKLREEGKTVNLAPLIEQILLRSKVNNPDIFRNINPEESEGYVSVQQLREAKQNVNAALTGTQLPFPPNPKDDHVAKLEIYTSIKELLDKAGQISEALNQIIQIQAQLLQQAQEEQAKPGNTLNKPTENILGIK